MTGRRARHGVAVVAMAAVAAGTPASAQGLWFSAPPDVRPTEPTAAAVVDCMDAGIERIREAGPGSWQAVLPAVEACSPQITRHALTLRARARVGATTTGELSERLRAARGEFARTMDLVDLRIRNRLGLLERCGPARSQTSGWRFPLRRCEVSDEEMGRLAFDLAGER